MKVSYLNYEAYLIDYLDGQLNTEEIELLKAFIEAHAELGTWETLTDSFNVLPVENLIFENKKSLYQSEINATGTISENNYEEIFISFHEQLLNKDEQRETIQFIQKNKSLQKEFQLYERIKFQPETTIVFEQKEQLKQKNTVLWYRNLAVAATITLLIGIGFLFQTKRPTLERNQIARIPSLKMRKTNFSENNNKYQNISDLKRTVEFIAKEIPLVETINRKTIAEIPVMKPAVCQSIQLTEIASIQYAQTIEKMYFYFDIQTFLAEHSAFGRERKRADSFTSNLKNQIHYVSKRIIRLKTQVEEQVLNTKSENLVQEISNIGNFVFSAFNKEADEKE